MQWVPKTMEEAVRWLVTDHARVDGSISAFWHFPDPRQKTIRLIEVADAVLPPENGHVDPIRFWAHVDFPFEAEIAMLSPEDWARVQAGTLLLPAGWSLPDAKELPAKELR